MITHVVPKPMWSLITIAIPIASTMRSAGANKLLTGEPRLAGDPGDFLGVCRPLGSHRQRREEEAAPDRKWVTSDCLGRGLGELRLVESAVKAGSRE
jgi:hypothetical protein